eukprot:scaffold58350_cov31-Tisochrysis_lutea.AAC.2
MALVPSRRCAIGNQSGPRSWSMSKHATPAQHGLVRESGRSKGEALERSQDRRVHDITPATRPRLGNKTLVLTLGTACRRGRAYVLTVLDPYLALVCAAQWVVRRGGCLGCRNDKPCRGLAGR